MLTIKKAFIKDNLFLSVEFSEVIPGGTKNSKDDYTAPVHDDMKRAFRKLNIHLAHLSYQVVQSNKKNGIVASKALPETGLGLDPDEEFYFTQPNWEIIDNTFCEGFQIGGVSESEGVTLIGYRILPNGKSLSITAPRQKWENDNYSYPHLSELGEILTECKAEILAYLLDGKQAPDLQGDLFAETDEELNLPMK